MPTHAAEDSPIPEPGASAVILTALAGWMPIGYFAVVVWWEDSFLGLRPPGWLLLAGLFAMLVASFHVAAHVYRRAVRARRIIHNLTLGSLATMLTILAADTVAAIVARPEPRGFGRADLEASAITDSLLWPGQIIPRHYRVASGFDLHKPGFASRYRVYGSFYYSAMLDLPILVDSVLTVREITTIIDAHGARETTPLGEARILALGDSFVFGADLSQEFIWVERFEDLTSIPTYNLGVGGDAPQEQVRRLRHFLLKDELRGRPLHVLWMIFEGNDLDGLVEPGIDDGGPDGLSRVFSGTLLSLAEIIPATLQRQSLLYRLRSGALRLRVDRRAEGAFHLDGVRLVYPLYHSPHFGPRLFHNGYIENTAMTENDVLTHPGRSRLDSSFDDMGVLAREHDLTVTVILAPTAARLYAAYYDAFPPISAEPHFLRYVERLATARGFGVVDLTDLLRPHAEQELLYWRDDTHWNERGNELVASLIAEYVRR